MIVDNTEWMTIEFEIINNMTEDNHLSLEYRVKNQVGRSNEDFYYTSPIKLKVDKINALRIKEQIDRRLFECD